MRRATLCLGATFLLAACSSAPWRPMTDWVQAWQLINRADELVQSGGHAGARALYEQVVQEYPASPRAPEALFKLARLEVTPESPVLNYRQAHDHFDRLLKEYPENPYAAEARAWRETLGQLLAREREATRIRQDMERLKRVEMRLEQEKRREAEEAGR